MVSLLSFRCFGGFVPVFRCFGGFVSVFRWFRSGVSVVSAVPVVSVVSFRWFRFGVSGFSTCQRQSVRSHMKYDLHMQMFDFLLRGVFKTRNGEMTK